MGIECIRKIKLSRLKVCNSNECRGSAVKSLHFHQRRIVGTFRSKGAVERVNAGWQGCTSSRILPGMKKKRIEIGKKILWIRG